MTPRYACNLAPGCISSEPTFAGLRKNKKTRGPKKRGPESFLWQSLTSLEMQPGAKLQRISRGHYFAASRCTQRFRLRILRRTRSNAGRTSARSLSGKNINHLVNPLYRERYRECRDSLQCPCIEIPPGFLAIRLISSTQVQIQVPLVFTFLPRQATKSA